jgi:hypothetical protein
MIKKLKAYREKHFERGLQYILLALLTTFVICEFQEIYGMMTRTSIVTVVNADVIVSPTESPNIELEQAVKSQESNSHLSIEELVRQTFKEDPDTAVAVMKAESQGDCARVGDQHIMFEKNGVNYGASYGCFQIRHLEGRPDPKKLLDKDFNIDYAYKMYLSQGWKPWSAWKSGAYLKYM